MTDQALKVEFKSVYGIYICVLKNNNDDDEDEHEHEDGPLPL